MFQQKTNTFKRAVSLLAALSLLAGIFTVSSAFSAGADTDYEYVPSVLFNNSLSAMWSNVKLDGTTTYAEINTAAANKPDGVDQSIRFGQSTAVSSYPAVHFWNVGGGGNGVSFGDLFGAADTSKYEGIRLWIKKGTVFGYSRILVFLGRQANGAALPTSGEQRYVYSITGAELTAAGAYIDIPFESFHINRDPARPSYDPATIGNPNYIAFQSGDGSGAKLFECFVADLKLYREAGSGEPEDPEPGDDDYEYVSSTTFNTATQSQWNAAYYEGASSYATVQPDTANKPLSASQSVKIGQSTDAAGYPSAMFWNNVSNSDRRTYGDLFGSADVTKYDGIKIWLKKGDMPYASIRIRIGRMGSGGWWPAGSEFYTYTASVSSIPAEGGYLYIPFASFVTPSSHVNYDPASNGKPNFIGFQSGDGSKKICSFYVSDLQLYREKDDGEDDPEDPGDYPEPNPDDPSNPANPDYIYVPSDVFNFASQEQWNNTKIEGAGTTRTVDTTPENKHPSAYQSMKLHATGATNYAAVFFWNETAGRTPYGDLFGTLNTAKCLGIRIYIKTSEQYAFQTLKVFIDRIGSTVGYYKTEDRCFIADLQIEPGFSGYVDIPFTSFIRQTDGVAYSPANKPDHIVFKLSGGTTAADDVWFSNLFTYYEGEPEPGELVETPLDTVNYEYIPSKRFNDATQAQWNQTKKSGAGTNMVVTSDGLHTPAEFGKSYCFHTAGDTRNPEVFFWREYIDESGKAARSTYGELFDSADTSQYLGIALWVELSPGRAGTKLKVMLGRMSGPTYWPSSSKGFFEALLPVPAGGYKGYVYIPFESFKDLTGATVDPKSKPNFIAFKYSDDAAVESDTYIYDLRLYRKNTGEKEPEKTKIYSYFPSGLFNTSTQNMWNNGRKEGGVPVVKVNQTNKAFIPSKMDRSFVYHTDKNALTSNYPGVYFWKESEDMKSRATFGNLFDSMQNREYDGIRVWLKTGEEHYDNLYVIFGRMSGSTYWPGNGFYTAKVEIPYEGLDGYVHIPFEDLTNSVGLYFNNARKANFIGFKYSDSTKRTTDLYISDLALYKVTEVEGSELNPQTSDSYSVLKMAIGLMLICTGIGLLLLQNITSRKGMGKQ